jgi:hypothetical protein
MLEAAAEREEFPGLALGADVADLHGYASSLGLGTAMEPDEIDVAFEVAGLARTTDENGHANWSCLPPLRLGYRWVNKSHFPLNVEPLHESGVASERGAREVSGLLRPKSGERISIEIVAPSPSSIIGQLDLAGEAAVLTQVKTYVETRHPLDGGRSGSFSMWHFEATCAVERDGTFRLSNLSAGQRVVRFHWELDGGDQCFAVRTVDVGEGQVCDLGVVSPNPVDLLVHCRFIDSMGRVLDLSDVIGERATLLVEMSAIVEGQADERIIELFELAIGPGR